MLFCYFNQTVLKHLKSRAECKTSSCTVMNPEAPAAFPLLLPDRLRAQDLRPHGINEGLISFSWRFTES